MMDWLWHFVWTNVPVWAWIVLAGLVVGALWRRVGWQGLAGAAAAVAGILAYRQGYRDADKGKPPAVPVEDFEQPIAPKPKPKQKMKTLQDILKGRG